MPLNFGPPVIDFSPLGKLGETYDAGVKRNREAEMNAARQKALAGFGQNGDLAALGQTLLRSGDLEGGMTALRMHAANEGTPWQREQAAAEAARAGASLAETRRAREDAERHRQTQEERSRYVAVEKTVTDSAGNETTVQGERDLTTGITHWNDGTTSGGRGTGPRSGGEDDPSLPQPNAATAQLKLSPQTSTDPGYVIPGTLQRFPVGTELPPTALAQLQPPTAAGSAAVAQPAIQGPTTAPLAPPPATGAAVAAPLPPVAAAPNASTVQPRATREDPLEPPTVPFVRKPPPNVNIKGWIAAEVKRVAEVTGLDSGGKPPTESQAASAAFANRMQGAEKEFRPVTEDSTGFGNRLADVITGGSGFIRNKLTSDKYQASIAAKKEWIAALLRKDSGAAVSDQEFDYYNDVYFPKAGQSEVLVKQYERARERAYEGLKQGLTPGQITNLSQTAAGGGAPLAPARGTPGEAAAPPVLKFDANGNAVR